MVRRTTGWNEREYGREKWPAIDAAIERAIAAGERELARVVAIVSRQERDLEALAPQFTCIAGSRLELPAAVAHGAHDALIVECVVAACRPSTGLVVELGAGWGRNLAAVWLAGGPASARYVAAEVTGAGRRAAARLASLAAFDLEVISYDFERPSTLGLPQADHAVVFTCHGIGQVPRLPEEAITSIAAVASTVTCVHVEPFGWQIVGDPDAEPARYAERHDYNRNLWQRLQAAESAGEITIDRVVADAVGVNPAHPSSLVVWHAPAG